MALAAWSLWRQVGFAAPLPWIAYAVQLALNVAWSALFFSLRDLRAAFADILALWAAILVTLVTFAAVSPLSGLLLLPYLVWVAIAGTLNLKVWRLNPDPTGQPLGSA